ncbi:hypothetical protein HK405_002441, partial [Cladochytrium tenue]
MTLEASDDRVGFVHILKDTVEGNVAFAGGHEAEESVPAAQPRHGRCFCSDRTLPCCPRALWRQPARKASTSVTTSPTATATSWKKRLGFYHTAGDLPVAMTVVRAALVQQVASIQAKSPNHLPSPTMQSPEQPATPTNRAAWVLEKVARPLVVRDTPYTKPGENQVVVRNHAVAVNPVDAALQANSAIADNFTWVTYPAVFGCDVAGVVEEVGPGVDHLRPGDRVLACA